MERVQRKFSGKDSPGDVPRESVIVSRLSQLSDDPTRSGRNTSILERLLHQYSQQEVAAAVEKLSGSTAILARRLLATSPAFTDERAVPPSGNQSTDDGTENVG